MWKPNTSDVYVATRTLGGILKASIHESGRCHVRAPDPSLWRSPGAPPRYLDTWHICPQATYAFPFGIIIPEQELRAGEWAKHRDRGTIWLPTTVGQGIEIAIFLIRTPSDQSESLASAGWHTTLVNASLPDGRILLVVAGNTTAHLDRKAELDEIKAGARALISTASVAPANPRLLLFATNESGTRRFIEVAANEA